MSSLAEKRKKGASQVVSNKLNIKYAKICAEPTRKNKMEIKLGVPKKKVKINGKVYESYKSASLSLDICICTIRKTVRKLERSQRGSLEVSVKRIEKLEFSKLKPSEIGE